MKTYLGIIGAPLLCSGLMLAQNGAGTPMPQDNAPKVATSQREWTGLLVASGCSADTSATQMSDMTTGQRTTSPHETNTDYEQRVNQADRTNRSNAAEVGAADRSVATPDDEKWNDAQQVAKQMPDSCRIGESTSSFALRLRDGRVVNFDSAGNAQIRQQLQSTSRVAAHKTKIFRVSVKGDLQGNVITLESIRL